MVQTDRKTAERNVASAFRRPVLADKLKDNALIEAELQLALKNKVPPARIAELLKQETK